VLYVEDSVEICKQQENLCINIKMKCEHCFRIQIYVTIMFKVVSFVFI